MFGQAAMGIGWALATAVGVAYGAGGGQVYDRSDWVKFGCTTYALSMASTPQNSGLQNAALVYDPVKAWDSTPKAGTQEGYPGLPGPYPIVCEGYHFMETTWPDSAAAATAISTGRKTYNNAINWSDLNASQGPTIVEIAEGLGKSTGTISTVQWSHATPAGLSTAHNISRNNYQAIADAMLSSDMEVIMGAGHPQFNDSNVQTIAAYNDPAVTDSKAKYVGGRANWIALNEGTHASGRTLIQSKSDFESLAAGTFNGGNLPAKLVGTAQVASTLQQSRGGDAMAAPCVVAPNSGVPTLAVMTKGALNVLDKNPNGFFLHIEGGAVDWANHANQPGRMIEEQIDFNNAVEAVSDYLNANTHGNNWANTLVILTADHECGMLFGPDSDTLPFAGLVNNGAGHMPGMKYNSDNHTNALVPVYAKGPGSELFAGLVDGVDAQVGIRYGRPDFDGRYIDNTDIFTVMNSAYGLGAKNVILMISDGAGFNTWSATNMYEFGVAPEPATLAFLAGGCLVAIRRRRSA